MASALRNTARNALMATRRNMSTQVEVLAQREHDSVHAAGKLLYFYFYIIVLKLFACIII